MSSAEFMRTFFTLNAIASAAPGSQTDYLPSNSGPLMKHAVIVAIPVERCEKPDQRMKMLKMIRRIFWVVVFLVLAHPAFAKDERSIRDLSKALAGLWSDVDPKEAELVSITAHTTARKLARDYHVVLNPEFQAFLVNVGARKRGWCGHWAQDIGTQLKELKLRMLVFTGASPTIIRPAKIIALR